MTVIDMAKAHIQNVNQRIEELINQSRLIQQEIEKLQTYVDGCIKDIQACEQEESK
jgi:prefoldin subunit 5